MIDKNKATNIFACGFVNNLKGQVKPVISYVRWASARSGVKVPKARSWSIKPKPIAKDKVQTVRNVLKEILGEPLPQRTEITYKAYLMDKTA